MGYVENDSIPKTRMKKNIRHQGMFIMYKGESKLLHRVITICLVDKTTEFMKLDTSLLHEFKDLFYQSNCNGC